MRPRVLYKRDMSLSARGILHPVAALANFEIARCDPSADLALFIERYWLIRWDLRDRAPHAQATLPYPCVNVVFERDGAAAWGTSTRKFTKLLEGEGQVVGVKFRPGGFYPFVNFPITELADRSRSLSTLFGDTSAIEREVMATRDHTIQIQRVEEFFRARLPERDPNIEAVAAIVQIAENFREIVRVDDLVARSNMSLRALQRLFRRYVGVSPKWVIRRFRIHEAAQRAEQDKPDWSAIAHELGYCDQAHFIRDFKAQVGKAPGEYALECAPT